MPGVGDRRGPGMGQIGQEQHPLAGLAAPVPVGRSVSSPPTTWVHGPSRPASGSGQSSAASACHRIGQQRVGQRDVQLHRAGYSTGPARRPRPPGRPSPASRRSAPTSVAAQRIRGTSGAPGRTPNADRSSGWHRHHAATAADPRTARSCGRRRDGPPARRGAGSRRRSRTWSRRQPAGPNRGPGRAPGSRRSVRRSGRAAGSGRWRRPRAGPSTAARSGSRVPARPR